MVTATNKVVTTVKMVEVEETSNVVSLTLTEEEAAVIMQVIGNIVGGGKYRKISDNIYHTLAKLEIKHNVPELQRATAFHGEYNFTK